MSKHECKRRNTRFHRKNRKIRLAIFDLFMFLFYSFKLHKYSKMFSKGKRIRMDESVPMEYSY